MIDKSIMQELKTESYQRLRIIFKAYEATVKKKDLIIDTWYSMMDDLNLRVFIIISKYINQSTSDLTQSLISDFFRLNE